MKVCCAKYAKATAEAEAELRRVTYIAISRDTPSNLTRVANAKGELTYQRAKFEEHQAECDGELTTRPLPKGRTKQPQSAPSEPKIDRRRIPKVMPTREEMAAAQSKAAAQVAANHVLGATAMVPDERLESPNGRCHRCSRPVSGERRLCGSCAAGIPICTCGHGRSAHDVNRVGQRTACSVSSGPRADACPCTRFEEESLP